MSESRTIIADEERLANVHPGDILREDFLVGVEIAVDEVADGTGLPRKALIALIEARADIDADTDLRLGRYFGMSDGFFLRLQNAFDLEEARRSLKGDLERIVPRAA